MRLRHLLPILALLGAPPAGAEPDHVLHAVADTSFEWGINDNNYGPTDGLHLRQYASNSRDYFAYIRFDLSTIDQPITGVTLRLRQKSGATITNGRIRVLGLDPVAGNTPQDWDENAIRPSTLGGEFTAPTSTLSDGSSPFFPARVTSFDGDVSGMSEDISSDAQNLEIVHLSGKPLTDWLEACRSQGGLATLIVDIPGGQGVDSYLHSRETTVEDAAPELQVFTSPILKVWPLGDSITHGAGSAGGYRETFYSNVSARGVPIRMLGTGTGNSTALLDENGQSRHDGHSGYAIDDAIDMDDGSHRNGLYDGVVTWHQQIETPDVILLMIGINDLNIGFEVATADQRLDALVERLFGYFPDTRILVASLPAAAQNNPFRHGATNDLAAAVGDYNDGMLAVVADHRDRGRKIERVDMHSVLSLSDLGDGLHPNAGGYAKLGNAWADAVVEEPATNPSRVRVVLQGGQSNADGRAGGNGQPSYSDIDFYYNTDHIRDVGVVERLTTLFPGASRDRALGPEISFGRRLADILGCDGTDTRLGIIKHAEGGTSLFGDWKAGGDATTAGDGAEYVIFQQTVARGMAALANKYPNAEIEIEGMVWMQGETDAQVGRGGEYGANLTAFIADVRSTILPGLPFVIGRLSDNQEPWLERREGAAGVQGLADVRGAQNSVAAADPRVGIVDTDGFGVNPPNDEIHFNTEGQVALGRGFAERLGYLISANSQLEGAQIDAGLGESDRDPDGDGVPNGDEFLAGSPMGEPNPPFSAGIGASEGGSLMLSFPGGANRRFVIESSPDLSTGSWSGISVVPGDSSGVTVFPVPMDGDSAFFRVSAGLP